jgi:hypothetical protein
MKAKSSKPTTALVIHQSNRHSNGLTVYEATRVALDEGKSFKVRLRNLARLNGRAAKQKAARLALILKVQASIQSPELSNEAAHLARTVSYHLRQAAIIGRHISKIEKRER